TARAPSSRCLPRRGAVLMVLELDAHRLELVADAVGLPETFRLARGITCIDERVHLIRIDDMAMRMIFERLAFRELEQSKKPSRRLQFVLELQLMQSRCAASNFTRKRMQPRQRAWCV